MRLLTTRPGRVTRLFLRLLLRPGPAGPGVLIVTRPDLFPADHGAAVRTDRTAHAVSCLSGPVFIVTDDRRYYHRYLNGRRDEVRYPRWLGTLGPWRRLIAYRLRVGGVPATDCFLYLALRDWSIDLRAAYVASKHGLRIFQAEFPAYARVCAWVSSLLGGSSLLVEHNVEYARLAEQFPDHQAIGHTFLRRVEIELGNRVDAVVTVSQRDHDTLRDAGVAASKLSIIPHGVDLGAFDRPALSRSKLLEYGIPPDRPVLVYHGTYLYPPNLEAIVVLCNEVLPRLQAVGIRGVVLAIGPHPPSVSASTDVFFTGSVASVAPYLRAADVAVMPLQQGAGTRMKVMDYFAAGVPVVTTSKGVEGLGLLDGRELLVRDDWDGFARAIGQILEDRHTADSLVEAGRRYVERLDWSQIARRYIDLYGAISRA